MEEATSQSLEEDFKGQATHTGPKGVINDWRKFKLESEDGDSIPPSKKEILRQMSSPQSRDDKDSKERISRKVRAKINNKSCIFW
uniref:Phosducin n=1 Tax=Nannospalax galili TaxID=1026970 RepID=A0A8C6R0C7_NANGA